LKAPVTNGEGECGVQLDKKGTEVGTEARNDIEPEETLVHNEQTQNRKESGRGFLKGGALREDE